MAIENSMAAAKQLFPSSLLLRRNEGIKKQFCFLVKLPIFLYSYSSRAQIYIKLL